MHNAAVSFFFPLANLFLFSRDLAADALFSSDYTPVLEYFLVFVMEIVIFDEFLNVYLGLFVSREAL